MIITHGCPDGASILWPYNGVNIRYTTEQFLDWLYAYTTAPQITLTLVACGGAVFAWRLMEEETGRRVLPFADDQTVFVKDPNSAYEDEVLLVENGRYDVESDAHPETAVQPAQRSAPQMAKRMRVKQRRRWRR